MKLRREAAIVDAQVHEAGCFVFYLAQHGPPHRPGRVLVGIADENDEGLYFHLPQLDLYFPAADDPEDSGRALVERLLDFYGALQALGEDYWTDVEDSQLKLLEDVFLPWLEAKSGEHLVPSRDMLTPA